MNKPKQSPKRRKGTGTRNQQVARAGEHFVVAEINKRGAFAVPFAGNMPKIDVIASNKSQSRTVLIQVKAKSGGQRTWQTSVREGKPIGKLSPSDATSFWVLVDLGLPESPPRFWIVPDAWIRNDIYRNHRAYLAKHGGRRARSQQSLHHAIDEKRVAQWHNQWNLLDIFG
jgi:hypothetical protein